MKEKSNDLLIKVLGYAFLIGAPSLFLWLISRQLIAWYKGWNVKAVTVQTSDSMVKLFADIALVSIIWLVIPPIYRFFKNRTRSGLRKNT